MMKLQGVVITSIKNPKIKSIFIRGKFHSRKLSFDNHSCYLANIKPHSVYTHQHNFSIEGIHAKVFHSNLLFEGCRLFMS